MVSLSAICAANAAFKPTYGRPVGIFVGGTSGIGAAMASKFAEYTNGNADIVIVGRNREAADSLFNAMPKPTDVPAPRREFVPCDATLMRDVGRVTAELKERYPKINFLVVSQGILTLKGRDETDEGIDKKLALHYYSRWRFIYDLVPQLEAAKKAGEDGKAMTVMAAGMGGRVDVNDFGLKKGYSVTAAGLAAPTYNDCLVESFAARHPTLSFVHAFPGTVDTPLISNLGGPGSSILRPLSIVFAKLTGIKPDVCAEYMWYGLFNAGPGASRTGSRGAPVTGRLFTDGVTDKLWEHTVAETRVSPQ